MSFWEIVAVLSTVNLVFYLVFGTIIAKYLAEKDAVKDGLTNKLTQLTSAKEQQKKDLEKFIDQKEGQIANLKQAIEGKNEIIKQIKEEESHLLAKSFAKERSDLKKKLQQVNEQVDYLLKRESPTIIQLGEHVNMLNQELKLKEDMIHKLILELDKERKKDV